jgi:hypothetical protein
VLQLGHPPGKACPTPRYSRTGFIVVDIDYIQEVNLRYCFCTNHSVAGDAYQQLLRRHLFPATLLDPHTAFTFRALNFFHKLTLHGKVTAYDFYRAIESRTDAAGVLGLTSRYDAFLRVERVWREIKKLRRAGFGNLTTTDVATVNPGAFALRCWACPNPQLNLPPDWKQRAQDSG